MTRWKTFILCSFFAINLLVAVLLTIPLLSNPSSGHTLHADDAASNGRHHNGQRAIEFQTVSKSISHSLSVKQSSSKSFDDSNERIEEAAKRKPYITNMLVRNVNKQSVNRQIDVYEPNSNAAKIEFVRRQTTTNLHQKYASSVSKTSRATLKSLQSHASTYLRDKSPERQIHDYVLEPRSNFCDESTTATTLLIAVCSFVLNFELRQAIRSTWGREGMFEEEVVQSVESLGGSVRPIKTRLLFIVALPDERNARLQSYVNSESSVYGDVLQLNFSDHYANLTLKTLGAMRWMSERCKSASFFLKADDDVFINVPNVLQLISSSRELSSESDVIVGHVMHDARPVRDRKSTYYTPYAVFRESIFPPYTSGSGYLLSSASVEKLLAQSLKRSVVFWLEDIYFTGMLAKELGFTLVHDSRFNYNKQRQGHYRDACWYQDVVTEHGLTPKDLYQISIDAWYLRSKGDSSERTLRSRNCTGAVEKNELFVRDLMGRT